MKNSNILLKVKEKIYTFWIWRIRTVKSDQNKICLRAAKAYYEGGVHYHINLVIFILANSENLISEMK